MRHLTLLRHADAADPAGTADRDRPLSPRGREQSRHLAAWCQAQSRPPDLWLLSDARRARETLRELARAWGGDLGTVREEATLYLAEADQILERIRAAEDRYQHVCVVGHNPGLSVLATWLCRRTAPGLGTACLVTMPLELADWSSLQRDAADACEGWSA